MVSFMTRVLPANRWTTPVSSKSPSFAAGNTTTSSAAGGQPGGVSGAATQATQARCNIPTMSALTRPFRHTEGPGEASRAEAGVHATGNEEDVVAKALL